MSMFRPVESSSLSCKSIFHTLGFYQTPCGSDGKESACCVGDSSSIPGLVSSPGVGNGNTLQYFYFFFPVFLSREFHGEKSLAGYSPWSCRVGYDWATNTHNTRTSHMKCMFLLTFRFNNKFLSEFSFHGEKLFFIIWRGSHHIFF